MTKCIRCGRTNEQVSFDEYMFSYREWTQDYLIGIDEEPEFNPVCDSCINSEEEERERKIKEDRKLAEQGMKEAFGIESDDDVNWGDYLEMNGYT